ncbi:complement receptor type 2-like [Hypanus sabinus]|uniref:complement receptor type 2-like n=1 Tax=Hypanus sabinus TaxID=79690 RepID=UPI0028C42BDA|nr:complement receptor type 2-like [Hypanus sabinus]
MPDNGYIIPRQTLYRYDQQITFVCNTGYELVGSRYSRCGDEGTFTPPPPTCRKVQCERPRNLNNAIIYPDQHIYYYEDHVTFSCLPGYILMGSIESVCVGRDTFDPPPPTCKKVQCERPRNLNNAIIYPDQHIYYYEDHVTFSCLPGYILMGSIESVCVGRDTFDPPPPTCKKDNSEWTISKTARGKINTIIQWSHEIINEKKDIIQMENRLLQKEESILLKYQAIVQNLEIFLNRTSIPKAA